MAGPWLYVIAAGRGHTFKIGGSPISVTFDNYRQLVENGRLIEDRWWRISQYWEHIRIVDDMFIYTGAKGPGIIGYAKIKSVEKRGQGWYLEPEFDLSRCRMLLNRPVSTSVIGSWKLHLRRNPVDLSGLTLELYSRVPWTVAVRLPEEIIEGSTYIEGGVERILVNRYERDPRAREDCILCYGSTCILCGFDFVAKHGQVMEGFIHVHHVKPLSILGADYKLDPIQDLRPLCPNCHAVVHRRDPPYELEEVRQLLQSQS